jgi:hypothetical protein
MGTVLTILGITLAVAAWDLTGETAAEYVAKYIVDQEDLGASTSEPVSLENQVVAATTDVRSGENASSSGRGEAVPAPVLMSSLTEAPKVRIPRPPLAIEGRITPISQTSPIAETAPAPVTEPVAELTPEEVDPLLSLIGDTPHRRPDGTVFMPIAAQRVFGLRTVIGERVTVPQSIELPGRIITNPSSAHLIQTAEDGFVSATQDGFPYAGQKVRRGQLMARLTPALTTIEKAEYDARIQELTNEIDLKRKQMARLEEVVMVRYRTSRIEQMRVEIEGLRRQLAVLRDGVERPIELRAQTDGVVSHVKAAAGQFVHAGHTLFEIIDPSRLWVSASAFEPDVQERLISASAVTVGGHRMALEFVGGGLELQHQALPLHFEIVGSSVGLSVDTPVTVVVQLSGAAEVGLRIPRDSVTRTSDGRELVWERRSAESFVAHHVTAKAIDAEHVLVTSPIGGSARIVTSGVATLGQVQ